MFARTFDDLPDVDVGLGPLDNLEAAGAGVFNPGPSQSYNIQSSYNYTDTVST